MHPKHVKLHATELVVKTHCSKSVFKFYGIVCWHVCCADYFFLVT
nr:MAG TPA: hypothetical protein [Caudoviricetes sp.]DAO60037.1 MAG TPA: hypothetical protein [Bacteriophage sp.]